MFWTVFMIFMVAWMLSLVLEFRLGVMPLVVVLSIMMAFIKLIGHSTVRSRKSTAR
jgi:ABC-type lipoprotein release transport system permease subunit